MRLRLRKEGKNIPAHRAIHHLSRTDDRKDFDEVLERLWILKEEGQMVLSKLNEVMGEENIRNVTGEMVQAGLVYLDGDNVTLSEEGEKRAEDMARRHRLAERLFSDLLELSDVDAESSACQFEHILTPESTDSLCAFLGHPPVCPHGKPIPRGECCKKFQMEIKPFVVPLEHLDAGESGRIVFIVAKYGRRLERLSALGIVPDGEIRLHQKHPAFIIQVGEMEIALDKEIVSEIYVKRGQNSVRSDK